MAELKKRNHRRDLEIVFLRENKKWIFKKIGERFNITRVRARQLYVRMVSERDRANTQMGIGA
jgi:hypothetical protein